MTVERWEYVEPAARCRSSMRSGQVAWFCSRVAGHDGLHFNEDAVWRDSIEFANYSQMPQPGNEVRQR